MDIIKRLRDPAFLPVKDANMELRLAAADEVERLRAVIIRYLDFSKDVTVSPVAPELKPIRDAMREAVGYEQSVREK